MNKKALIVLLLVSMLMVAEMDAWFIRFRRIRIRLRRILGDACKKTCPRACPKILGEACKFGCGKLCGRKKRMVLDPNVHMTPLPANIDFYDRNENKVIEIEEFAVALAQNVNEPGLQEAFNLTDTNRDYVLSEEEFLTAEHLTLAV
ncbi:EF-hand calcium-binding domain-containing protein 1-like [Liolophura sinensis]|uniref:EF-hand calcium-binding domain-containing protein 1-like n=1 Tax=Liolophura sinensis TaxID=3198878 RepID=UPI0031583D2D